MTSSASSFAITMKYIDTSLREAEQTVGFWMKSTVESKIREFRCQAGYFTLDGSSLLLPLLKQCASDGNIVRLLLGSNGGVTLASHIAFLAGTLGIPKTNVSLGVVSFDNCLYHPKVYHFVREDGSQTAYVGSANLTESGIAGSNVEAGLILDSGSGDDLTILKDIEARIENWFKGTQAGLSRINKHADIDDLLAAGSLALAPTKRAREIEEEGEEAATKTGKPSVYLKSIFKLPGVKLEESGSTVAPAIIPSSPPERRRFVRHTEQSFHYPQGTHLGHILTILSHFAGDRTGTAFDDQFIRLDGSLGSGRLAAYRRQIKYKMLAAIELGLITDIRLIDDTISYVPALTDAGRKLWNLIKPFVKPADLVLKRDENGDYSTAMQQANYYNEVVSTACDESAELQKLYHSCVLNMPAVKQMLILLYQQERTATVAKVRIYETFFESDAVKLFCDEIGIEAGTVESAKHRCPFLLNLLESCRIVGQNNSSVLVGTLALAPDVIVAPGTDPKVGEKMLPIILADWGKKSTLALADQKALRNLFGASFLTDTYYLKSVMQIPAPNVQ